MLDNLAGFDWDAANRKKCEKHGVSIAEIERLFVRTVLLVPDHVHSREEIRIRAIGRTETGRSAFLVFTIREQGGKRFIRPISARFMHSKEVASYEKENPSL
jgi:uncharacterized DUF497 family protein